MTGIFTDLKLYPYWWEAAPRPEETLVELPAEVDALVVGGGFSGLNTALVLARAGKSVLVCEANFTGYGASTRNGGMLGPSFHKLGVKGLTARYGVERTHAILKQ
ncbi:MAG: FAD-dependent oxidoreductase, partial [Woeseiaceae bacterium]|nr:FAD-dependent oxidoreductase [Woeseiaceae bacterium]